MISKSLIGFVYKEDSRKALDLVTAIVKDFDMSLRSWIQSSDELQVGNVQLSETALIIVAGGDGTILKIAKISALHRIPIVGINLGRIGFMSEIEPDEINSKLNNYLSFNTRLEKRFMLKAAISGSDSDELDLHALNDIVISHSIVGNVIDVLVKVDGVSINNYRADGVIIASPTGSTAYAFAAGGPVIYPEAKTILIQPLAPHMSLGRAMVISGESRVEISIANGSDAIMSVDGTQYGTAIKYDDIVTVSKSPYAALFLREKDPDAFYKNLSELLSN
mgnify:CR=1 FL=1